MSDRERYLRLFVDEGRELLEELGEALGRFEEGEGKAVDVLFRAAHSLKGMAASLGLTQMERLAHALEDLFESIRQEGRLLEESMLGKLWEGTDTLSAALEAVAGSGEEPCLEELTTSIRELAAASHEAPPSDAATETRPPAQAPASEGSGAEAEEGSDPVVPEDASFEAESPTADGPDEFAEPVAPASTPLPPPPLALGADQEDREEKRPPGRSPLQVRVCLSEEADLPAARLAVVRTRLEELGEVLEEESSAEGRELKCRLVGDRPATEVAAALRSQVGVQTVEVGLAPAPAGSEREDRSTVRIPAEVLDRLLEATTELFVHHAHLERLMSTTEEARFALERLKGTTGKILDQLLEARLLPFHSVVPVLERTVRDLERRLGKRARLVIEGDDVRLDRTVLEHLVDPLTHLLRNAMDHGLEDAEVRREAGKPEEGRLAIRLERISDTVALTLEDDGRGMDHQRLRERAVEAGALDAETASCLEPSEALLLATLPGITTAAAATEISGRGVGLDAVRDRVESLGGNMDLSSEVGRGTRVLLRLPPTVAVLHVFLVRVADQIYGVPVRKIEETLALRPGRLRRVNGRSVLPWRGDVAEAFGLEAALEGRVETPLERGVALVYRQRGEPRAAVVDEVIGCREVVIKPLFGPLEAMAELGGAAVLGDGSLAPVLDLENVGPPSQTQIRRTA